MILRYLRYSPCWSLHLNNGIFILELLLWIKEQLENYSTMQTTTLIWQMISIRWIILCLILQLVRDSFLFINLHVSNSFSYCENRNSFGQDKLRKSLYWLSDFSIIGFYSTAKATDKYTLLNIRLYVTRKVKILHNNFFFCLSKIIVQMRHASLELCFYQLIFDLL